MKNKEAFHKSDSQLLGNGWLFALCGYDWFHFLTGYFVRQPIFYMEVASEADYYGFPAVMCGELFLCAVTDKYVRSTNFV